MAEESQQTPPQQQAPASSTSSGKKVLIVEDDAGYRDVLQERLKAEGIEALTAVNGQQALQVLQNESVSLITLDLMMPGMDGVQFMYNLRNTNNKDTPVIVLSNLTQAIFPPGVKEYFVKADLSLNDLVVKIKGYLK